MASVYKPKGRTHYRIEYRNSANLIQTVCTDFTDKAAAKAMARDLERRAERERSGLPVAAEDKRNGPWEPLLGEYLEDLRRMNRTHTHVCHEQAHITKGMAACGFRSLSTFRVDGFAGFIARLARDGKSARTQNAYRATMYQFLRFACCRNWLEDNPLKHFRATPAKKVRYRRAYTPDELARLCQTPDGLLYHVAAMSGFRRGELQKMEKQDLSPYANPPMWHPRREITKARRGDRIAIIAELLPTIRKLWDSMPTHNSRLFPDFPRWNAIKKDLKRANIPEINAEGKIADFHSLRYTFCTILARVMPIHIVQKFMRHADIRLTQGLYNDLGLTDLWTHAQQVPSLGLNLPTTPDNTLPLALPETQKTSDLQGNDEMVV